MGEAELDDAHTGGLGALGTLADLELYALTLVEAAEAACVDLRVVNENVRSAAVGGDEAEALFAVEPLHSSLCHFCSSQVGGPATCGARPTFGNEGNNIT